MDEESDEELKTDRQTDGTSSSEDEDNTEETEVTFRVRRAGDSSNVFDFNGPPNGVNQSAASDINAGSPPFSIFILFCRQIFQITLDEINHYIHNTGLAKENKGNVTCVR
jgi:hypothetical protein